MAFFEILSNLMEKSGIKPSQLSKKLNFGKNQFKYWQDKGNIPSGEILVSLADYFECSVDYLLGRTSDPKQQIYSVSIASSNHPDEQRQRLNDNYDALNQAAQKALVDYSDFMTTKPENLKEAAEDNKNVS